MSAPRASAPAPGGIAVGHELPPFELPVTATVIVAGAIASRDFMPAHHDPVFAKAQGAPDVFMNILTTNGYVSRFVTDWAGPEARMRNLKIRLGAPNYPGDCMTMYGEVISKQVVDGAGVIEVAFRGTNRLGDHMSGTSELELPTEGEGGAR